jgi:hypothetical protein
MVSRLSRNLGITSRSEQRKGYTMPTQKRIKSALRSRSKSFIINLFMMAFAKLTKTEKISMLLKIQTGKISRAVRKTKTKRKAKGKKKTKAQIKAMRIRNLAKARRARKIKNR